MHRPCPRGRSGVGARAGRVLVHVAAAVVHDRGDAALGRLAGQPLAVGRRAAAREPMEHKQHSLWVGVLVGGANIKVAWLSVPKERSVPDVPGVGVDARGLVPHRLDHRGCEERVWHERGHGGRKRGGAPGVLLVVHDDLLCAGWCGCIRLLFIFHEGHRGSYDVLGAPACDLETYEHWLGYGCLYMPRRRAW